MANEKLPICEGCNNDPGPSIAWYEGGTNYELCQYCRRAYNLGLAHGMGVGKIGQEPGKQERG